MRGAGVKDYLTSRVANLKNMNADYSYNIDVAEGRGSEFRRITVEFIFVDADL